MSRDPDTVENRFGIDACEECGGLLAIQRRIAHGGHAWIEPRIITNVIRPEPFEDVDLILCASCGAVLFKREGDRNGA